MDLFKSNIGKLLVYGSLGSYYEQRLQSVKNATEKVAKLYNLNFEFVKVRNRVTTIEQNIDVVEQKAEQTRTKLQDHEARIQQLEARIRQGSSNWKKWQ